MPKCGYCKAVTGSVWQTPELVDICFGCMRRQRDELHAQVAAPSEEEAPASRLVVLEATVKTLYADLTRLMAALEELG